MIQLIETPTLPSECGKHYGGPLVMCILLIENIYGQNVRHFGSDSKTSTTVHPTIVVRCLAVTSGKRVADTCFSIAFPEKYIFANNSYCNEI